MQERIRAFTDITAQEQERMRACFLAQEQLFAAGSCILDGDAPAERVGILLFGTARLSCTDEEGRSSILEHLEAGDIFGRAFSAPVDGMLFQTVAVTPCRVLFFDYAHLVKRCENACVHHSRLVSNILQMAAHKTQTLSLHVSVLSQRSIRQKLMTYFGVCRFGAHGGEFRLPMTLTALSEYLSVDRSAMMREMKRMKEEGLIDFRGRDVKMPAPR